MKTYGAVLTLLAAVGCGPDTTELERYYQARLRQQMPAITRGIEERVRAEDKAACDVRVKDEAAQAETRALNRSRSTPATTGEPVPYSYPKMDQTIHPLLERIAKGHYDGLVSDTITVSSQTDRQETIELKFGSDCRSKRDPSMEEACYRELGIEYSRKDNTFRLFNMESTGQGEGMRYTGIELIGTGQQLRWEDVTQVRLYRGSSDETSFIPADVANTYKPLAVEYLQDIRSKADGELAKLAQLPKLE